MEMNPPRLNLLKFPMQLTVAIYVNEPPMPKIQLRVDPRDYLLSMEAGANAVAEE